MDEPILLQDIAFELNTNALMKRLRIDEDSRYAEEFLSLAQEALESGRPKAMYRVIPIESKSDDSIQVDGFSFKSRILRVNLEKAHRIFPYVATCGLELEEWSALKDDILHQFWADAIKQAALFSAVQALEEYQIERHGLGKTAVMSPGSLEDWPITEQKALFSLLGNTHDSIGVRLSESYLMLPTKSVSGIRFPTEETFTSCMLCPREDCPGRRAAYDEDLYDRKYGHNASFFKTIR